jgi:serine/threonine protein kinase
VAVLHQLGDFVTFGEEKAAHYLRDNLPNDWKIIANKISVLPNGTSREIDFLIVGEHRIFVVDEKGFRGRIHGNDTFWALDSRESIASPLNKMEMVARHTAGFLRGQVAGLASMNGIFVLPFVLLSDETVQILVQEPRRELICRLAEAIDTLKSLDRKGRDHSISPFIKEIVDRLHILPPRPSIPRSVNAYRILEELDGGPHYRAFLAEHDTGEMRRLKMYELTSPAGQVQEDQKALIYRDFHSLAKAANQGLSPQVDLPLTWGDGRYIVVPQHLVPMPTLRVMASDFASAPMTLDNALCVSQALLAAVAELHSQGVIHRNLTPDNTYLQRNPSGPSGWQVQFSDFDFARLPESGSIAPVLDAFALDAPYRAPELQVSLSFAAPASDIYSVGLMLAELFSGVTARDMLDPQTGEIRLPSLQFVESGLSGEEVDHLHGMLAAMVEKDERRRWQSVEEAQEFLGELCAAQRVRLAVAEDALSPPVASDELGQTKGDHRRVRTLSGLYQKGEIIDKQYEVERVLGQGATANTYLVTDVLYSGRYVLKQIRDPQHVLQFAGSEFNALKQLSHRGIVRVHDVRKPDDPFHLKLEYVEGTPLEEMAGEFPWPLSRCLDFAQDLLAALTALEDRRIAHRDLSARNIIVTSEGGPRLIDFGFAAPHDEVGNTAVGTLPFRTPELDRAEGWNPTCDTYALGVLLYWMATGHLPFAKDLNGRLDKEHPLAAPETPAHWRTDATVCVEIFAAIRRAISPDQHQRFASAQEFAAALRTAAASRAHVDPIAPGDGSGPVGLRVINDWVTDIQGMYRNSRIGNADNRGLDSEFALGTYVATHLDTELLPAVMDGKYAVVLLSGNPGDGKTAFLEKLGDALAEAGAKKLLSDDQNGWKFELNGHVFAANYDASESSKGKRANERLDMILAPLQGDGPPAPHLKYTALIAINDGKLREFLLFNPTYAWLGKQLSRLLERPDGKFDPRIALVDLKQRSIVGGQLAEQEGGDLYERVLLRLVNDEKWDACAQCRVRERCPIKFNRDSFADPVSGELVRGRLRALWQLTHLRRERHVTMRDMRSALAYILTASTTCEEVHREQEGELPVPPRWYNRLYFMAAFNPEDEGDDNLKEFACYDPAHTTSPRLDRFLHFRRQGAGVDGRHGGADEIAELFVALSSRSPKLLSGLNAPALGSDWYEAQKRRLFFEGCDGSLMGHPRQLPSWRQLLPYRHFESFLAAVTGCVSMAKVRDSLCEAISRASGIVDARLYRHYLCVRTSAGETQDLTVFKRFPHEEFSCRVIQPYAEWMEAVPNALELRHTLSDAHLQVGLDLYEILMRFTEGYSAGAEEQQPFVIDLSQFESRLLNQRASELLLVEAGRQRHRVCQADGKIAVLPWEQERSTTVTLVLEVATVHLGRDIEDVFAK